MLGVYHGCDSSFGSHEQPMSQFRMRYQAGVWLDVRLYAHVEVGRNIRD